MFWCQCPAPTVPLPAQCQPPLRASTNLGPGAPVEPASGVQPILFFRRRREWPARRACMRRTRGRVHLRSAVGGGHDRGVTRLGRLPCTHARRARSPQAPCAAHYLEGEGGGHKAAASASPWGNVWGGGRGQTSEAPVPKTLAAKNVPLGTPETWEAVIAFGTWLRLLSHTRTQLNRK